jgi:hypothetical protein
MQKLVKLHQFTYTLNLDTGDVVANESKGDRPVVDLATKLKVYAAYAKDNKLASAYNNGQSYAKVFGYVLNINTGKTTSNPDITKVFHRYA